MLRRLRVSAVDRQTCLASVRTGFGDPEQLLNFTVPHFLDL